MLILVFLSLFMILMMDSSSFKYLLYFNKYYRQLTFQQAISSRI